MTPTDALLGHGQSIWLDYIRRDLIDSGELQTLVDHHGVRGITSNPSIFEKAIAGTRAYDALLENALRTTREPTSVYESLAVRDIQDAADVLRRLYEVSRGHDGYVSLEVSPHLAHDTDGTIAEARRLWSAVARPNLMIKVPGTPAGIPALEALIVDGINVNVTLLFARDTYARVAETYLRALERRAAEGRELAHIAGVASFFVSRIDTVVDKLLDDRIAAAADAPERARLAALHGRAAIANAKLAYGNYERLYGATSWASLARRGAQPQRVLWASTSTKNPAYRDVIYVEELIGADTVNTLPLATLHAFRDHGRVRASLIEDRAGAARVMDELSALGIAMDDVTTQLLRDGVQLFADAYDKLLEAIRVRTAAPAAA